MTAFLLSLLVGSGLGIMSGACEQSFRQGLISGLIAAVGSFICVCYLQ